MKKKLTRHLSPAQAAHILRRSERTLEGWRQSGDGPAFIPCGRRVVYDLGDLLRWFYTRRRRSSDEYERLDLTATQKAWIERGHYDEETGQIVLPEQQPKVAQPSAGRAGSLDAAMAEWKRAAGDFRAAVTLPRLVHRDE